MITCIARPILPNEPCLLKGNEYSVLVVKGDDVTVSIHFPPTYGWTYDSLEIACRNISSNELPLDAYLGNQWVGSTEI